MQTAVDWGPDTNEEQLLASNRGLPLCVNAFFSLPSKKKRKFSDIVAGRFYRFSQVRNRVVKIWLNIARINQCFDKLNIKNSPMKLTTVSFYILDASISFLNTCFYFKNLRSAKCGLIF